MNLLNIYSGMYWLTRLDHIKDLFLGITIVCFAAIGLIIFIAAFHASEDDFMRNEKQIDERKIIRKNWFKHIRWIAPILLLFVLLQVFTPSKNEVIFIVAGGKTLEYAQKDTSLCKLPYQTTKFISEYLDKQIKELKNNK